LKLRLALPLDVAGWTRTIGAMAISKGDTVHWKTSQGETNGTAMEKKTKDFTFAQQTFKPTDDDPYWIVESSKTGAKAAHKESALRTSS